MKRTVREVVSGMMVIEWNIVEHDQTTENFKAGLSHEVKQAASEIIKFNIDTKPKALRGELPKKFAPAMVPATKLVSF